MGVPRLIPNHCHQQPSNSGPVYEHCHLQHDKPKAGEKTDKKGGQGQSVRWKAWWRQGNIKCVVSEEYASCWVHQDCHVADVQKAALKKAAGVSGGKDECQVRLKGREHDYWMGTEVGMLGGLGFRAK